MKFEFKKNGDISLTIKPEGNIENEFFKELFNGEVEVTKISSANHNGEVVLTIKKNQPKSSIPSASSAILDSANGAFK